MNLFKILKLKHLILWIIIFITLSTSGLYFYDQYSYWAIIQNKLLVIVDKNEITNQLNQLEKKIILTQKFDLVIETELKIDDFQLYGATVKQSQKVPVKIELSLDWINNIQNYSENLEFNSKTKETKILLNNPIISNLQLNKETSTFNQINFAEIFNLNSIDETSKTAVNSILLNQSIVQVSNSIIEKVCTQLNYQSVQDMFEKDIKNSLYIYKIDKMQIDFMSENNQCLNINFLDTIV
jgi:hypothetical protein